MNINLAHPNLITSILIFYQIELYLNEEGQLKKIHSTKLSKIKYVSQGNRLAASKREIFFKDGVENLKIRQT